MILTLACFFKMLMDMFIALVVSDVSKWVILLMVVSNAGCIARIVTMFTRIQQSTTMQLFVEHQVLFAFGFECTLVTCEDFGGRQWKPGFDAFVHMLVAIRSFNDADQALLLCLKQTCINKRRTAHLDLFQSLNHARCRRSEVVVHYAVSFVRSDVFAKADSSVGRQSWRMQIQMLMKSLGRQTVVRTEDALIGTVLVAV